MVNTVSVQKTKALSDDYSCREVNKWSRTWEELQRHLESKVMCAPTFILKIYTVTS